MKRVTGLENMKNSRQRKVARRHFIKGGATALLGLGCLDGQFTTVAAASHSMLVGGAPAVHNMLVLGTQTPYLYHLPMFSFQGFDSPHRFQVILEGSFKGNSNEDEYLRDRRANLNERFYSFSPQKFVLSKTDPIGPLKGMLFRGHLERGGQVVSKNVRANVNRVIFFREFKPMDVKPPELEYVLFGNASELFLAHRLVKPPDFDQILSVKILNASFTDDQLSKGPVITVPGRNSISQRLQPGKSVPGESRSDKLFPKFTILVDREIYFEEGELRTPPTFDPTPAELKAGFGN
jgi:hypothetical protein